jgi:hypothetical protein
MAHRIQISSEIVEKWQGMVDLLAALLVITPDARRSTS